MKERIIGACLILLICIPLIFIGKLPFMIFCCLIGILSLKELRDLKKEEIPLGIFISSIILFTIFIYGKNIWGTFPILNYTFIILLALIFLLPCLFYKNYSYQSGFYYMGCVLFLSVFVSSMINIRLANLWIFIYLCLIAVLTDTFAFLIGKTIGKHKCAPIISPNKTWEGSIGGALFGTIISICFYYKMVGTSNVIILILFTLFLSIVGELGDLFFSKIKREHKIKDFSHIIPGHGGILDRIDSFVFIVLTYILIIEII